MTEGWVFQQAFFGRRICRGCDRLQVDLIKSGRNPIREFRCKHPAAIERFALHPMQQYQGIRIGSSPVAPHWCPAGERKEEQSPE